MPVIIKNANIKYLDKLNVSLKSSCFYEKENHKIDIVYDAQTLYTVKKESQDFIVANHILEHMDDFLYAIESWLKTVKKNGFIFATVPDICAKNYIAGENFRLLTRPSHIFSEYRKNYRNKHVDESAITELFMHHKHKHWNLITPLNITRAKHRIEKDLFLSNRHTFSSSTIKEIFSNAAPLLNYMVKDIYTAHSGKFNMQEYRIVLTKK